ncbi:hypothetical protein MAC_04855 [Metarhizium acridum CQMa 102]|uniref:F-box domain-containing protein n=1 Tax=Metarhizium acridum (strain CQMa 102) TaxID=655827 RepID=E9E4Q7_METAQ|nr:uncharacterized protein MAC_04855 [Metarhizium acridum CQMa 102]EFY89080.1 hypothetical protein MAC_04855 [Metarhizium acridum CQMa 102]
MVSSGRRAMVGSSALSKFRVGCVGQGNLLTLHAGATTACQLSTHQLQSSRQHRNRAASAVQKSASTLRSQTPSTLSFLGGPRAAAHVAKSPASIRREPRLRRHYTCHTIHRRDFDCVVVAADPGQHDHARLTFFNNLGASGSAGLGRLQRLPLELLSSVCLLLDVQSAFNFSQANRSARQTIASIPQYRRLREHALGCIWALFRTGLAPRISTSTLLSTLSTERCVICGSFGGFVFLPTSERCCFYCIESAPALRTVSLHSLCKASGMPAAQLEKSIPVLRSVPGTYSSAMTRRSRRTYLASAYHTLEVLPRDENEDPRTTLGGLPDSQVLRCMASTRLPYASPSTGESQLGRSCKGRQIALEADMCEENFSRRERLYSPLLGLPRGKGALAFQRGRHSCG